MDAMKALGLNPGEQEMIDMTNEVNINGLIYYPDFCKLVLRKYREENREVLNQALFKVIPKGFIENLFQIIYCLLSKSFSVVSSKRFYFWLRQELRVSLCLSIRLSGTKCSFFLFLDHYFKMTSG